MLTLRGAMTAGTRRHTPDAAGRIRPADQAREDAWQRGGRAPLRAPRGALGGADVPTEGQKELLARFRVATPDERRFVRDALRAHLAEHFPELQAP